MYRVPVARLKVQILQGGFLNPWKLPILHPWYSDIATMEETETAALIKVYFNICDNICGLILQIAHPVKST